MAALTGGKSADLPTPPGPSLKARYVYLQASVDAGKGDEPLFHLRFRGSYCGHRGCDALVVPKKRALGPGG